ncbi:MAG: lipoate--protein ligase [Ignavibacteriae bacterium]|nr:lipoate--protein ligase [Ignavibacteriota bacterium]
MKLRLINNKGYHDPTFNLALEEYCVRNLELENFSYLLFYINEPSVIIGKHQNTVEEINSDYVHDNGIHVVRRISGGGAVYQDLGNLNFSFITKYTQYSIHNFEKFTKPVIETLQSMGVNAVLGGRNDITVGGRKISGNAQFTNMKSMFSHGTLLFDSNLDNVVEALNVKADKIESKGIKSIRSRVANITEFLDAPMTIEEFTNKITDSIFTSGENAPPLELTGEEWAEVMHLSSSKYRTWNWNYGRSPEFNIQKIHRFGFGQIDARIFVKDGNIEDIKFYGDYLGYGETEVVEAFLRGKPYRAAEVSEALKDIDLNFYFGNISRKEFVKFICQ